MTVALSRQRYEHTPTHRDAGFFLWWRQLPKESLSEVDQSDPICRAFIEGIERRTSVTLRYRTDSGQSESVLLLYPRKLYRRGSHAYVDGKCYPAGKFQTLRVDRILEATVSTSSGQAWRSLRSPVSALRAYWHRKTYGRGVLEGFWGVLLDLIVIAFIASLFVQGLRWLMQVLF